MAGIKIKTGPQGSSRQTRTYAACTHVTLIRVYSYHLRCDSCGNLGPLGWLYCCTQDHEELLREAICRGEECNFDDLGRDMVNTVKPRLRGPEQRATNPANFLEEMSPEFIAKTYTSEQLMTIFNQRKHLAKVLQQESDRKTAATVKESNTSDLAEFLTQSAKPWVPNPREGCKYRICPCCRPGGADRAYLSLDSIANGDVPATAATGWGFHHFGRRPICHPEVVANLGLRSQTASTAPSLTSTSPASTASRDTSSTEDNLESRLASLNMQIDLPTRLRNPETSSPYPSPQPPLPRSPGSPNLAAQAGRRESLDGDSSMHDSSNASVSLPSGAGNTTADITTAMEEHEKEEGKFSAQPLKVQNGVAMLEESVELHVPDVMTQV
ncbi:hypothetical protein CGLO_13358 [Colletotrichum gloeosporioides Cg-14]|uniref:Uncharacterized protein n=1 Tax=Colletotrichum gloeosporioides (strain Cg-14) TaxID=1237896 RepID=T0L7B7_COLGC|nr:hypothetical protein CGLO_13358 [Colletotrichum gloeosporioides Cg-14]